MPQKGFDMLGLLALGFTVSSIITGYLVFQIMKHHFQVPIMLNLPGAFFAGAAIMQFCGWIAHDAFSGRLGPPAPDVPWWQWIEFMALSGIWYAAVIFLLLAWRKNKTSVPGAGN
jgi:hypothetical protein